MITSKYTEKNFIRYGEQYQWAILFEEAGFSDLPDPKGEFDLQSLEDWLTGALVSRGMDEAQAREVVREQGRKFPA